MCKQRMIKEDVYETKFLDLLRSKPDLDCDLIIGGVDMPASFVWDESNRITEYGIEKYRCILEAEYTMLSNGNIEIHCDDENLGAEFCLAASGHIALSEYKKIFGDDEP